MTGRSALVRLAIRGLRRNLRASWLVVIFIALPVAVGSYLAIASRTVSDHDISRSQLDGVGDTELIVQSGTVESAFSTPPEHRRSMDAETVEGLRGFADDVEAADDDAMALWILHGVNAPVDSELTELRRVVAADWSRSAAPETFRGIEGRLPTTAGEVAVDRRAAGTLGLSLGDRFETAAGSAASVVGLVQPFDVAIWAQPSVYVHVDAIATETLNQHPQLGLVMGVSTFDRSELSDMLTDRQLRESWLSGGVSIRSGEGEPWRAEPTAAIDPTYRPEQMGTLITGSILVETALLAAAAFMVRARRRTTEVSRLTAIGATPPQISRMMLTEAGLLGLCGAALGSAVAFIAAVANLDFLTAVGAGFAVPDEPGAAFNVTVHPADLALPAALAVVAAVLAAWLPARRAAGVSSRQAESEAGAQRQPAASWHVIGPALLVVSLGGLYVADRFDGSGGGSKLATTAIVLSMLLMVAAAVTFTVAMMEALAQRADRLPLSLRFGVRHMSRNRARTAALAGGTAVIAMAAVVFLALAAVFDRSSFVVPEGAQVARVTVSTPDGSWLDLGHSTLNNNELDSELGSALDKADWSPLADVSANVDADHQVPLQYVVDGEGERAGFSANWAAFDDPFFHPLIEHVGAVVATPDLVAALDLDDDVVAAINKPGMALVTLPSAPSTASLWDTVDLGAGTGATARQRVETVHIDRPDLWGAGVMALIAPGQAPGDYRAEIVGGATDAASQSVSDWLVVSDSGFDRDERAWLSSQPAVTVASGYEPGQQSVGPQLIAALVVATLMLIITRVGAGLVAVESDHDTAIIAAVGGPAGIRRRLLGSQIGLMAALSVVAAVPLSLVFVWTFLTTIERTTFPSSAPDGILLPVPVYFIGLCLLMPLLAAGFVMATTRSGNPAMSRRIS